MTDWRMQGAAQRRRMGAPSSHLGGGEHMSGTWSPPTGPTENLAGDAMAEGLAGMAKNSRQPIGRDVLAGFVNSSAANAAPISRPKGSNLATDPGVQAGGNNHRQPNLVSGENGGARHGIRVSLPQVEPHENGPVQSQGRIISRGSFRNI